MKTFAFFLGLALIGAALTWRAVRYARVRKGIRVGLADADPGMRIAAVQQAIEIGMASTAPALLRAVRVETDPRVRAAVVEAVASRQWEPASTAAIVELRLWAKAYSDARSELHRPAVGTEPLEPGVAGTVLPPSLHPLREKEFRRRNATDVAAVESGGARPVIDPDPDPLAPVRVLVTGAGGAAERVGLLDDADPRVCADGGALALGHPWGASGAVAVVRLFSRLVRHGAPAGTIGVAAASIGGGMGIALVLEVAR